MPEPPRARFQIHLSTAIVLMFVAGVLIWANTREHTRSADYTEEGPTNYLHVIIKAYGWPFEYKSVYTSFDTMDAVGRPSSVTEYGGLLNGDTIIDGMVGLLIIFAVWFLCEWLIRRRTA